jgi:hypothetical protein
MATVKYGKLPLCYERIRDWLVYDGPAERPSAPKLWMEDKVVYERLVQLRTLLFQKAYSVNDAMSMMIKTYGISEATYYRDYRGLEFVFGDLVAEGKNFERLRYKEIQQKILQMALANKDMKAANAAMSNLIKLGGHDREDVEAIDPERLNPGMYALLLDSEVRDFIMGALASRGSLDISKLMDSMAQDIEVENENADEKDGDTQPG